MGEGIIKMRFNVEKINENRKYLIGALILGFVAILGVFILKRTIIPISHTVGRLSLIHIFMKMFAYDYPKDYPEPESVVAVLRKGGKVKEIPVIMRERNGGVSSISIKRSIYYMIKVSLAILIERIRK